MDFSPILPLKTKHFKKKHHKKDKKYKSKSRRKEKSSKTITDLVEKQFKELRSAQLARKIVDGRLTLPSKSSNIELAGLFNQGKKSQITTQAAEEYQLKEARCHDDILGLLQGPECRPEIKPKKVRRSLFKIVETPEKPELSVHGVSKNESKSLINEAQATAFEFPKFPFDDDLSHCALQRIEKESENSIVSSERNDHFDLGNFKPLEYYRKNPRKKNDTTEPKRKPETKDDFVSIGKSLKKPDLKSLVTNDFDFYQFPIDLLGKKQRSMKKDDYPVRKNMQNRQEALFQPIQGFPPLEILRNEKKQQNDEANQSATSIEIQDIFQSAKSHRDLRVQLF